MRIFTFLQMFFLSICFLSSHYSNAQAASPQMEVHWVPNVYSIGQSTSNLLERPGVRSAIAEILTNKIHELDASGNLPFTLKERLSPLNNMREDFSDETIIGLMPLMLLDASFKSVYHIGEQTFYKTILASSLSLAICSAEPETQGWRILAIVPMDGATIIGNTNDLRVSPITEQQEAEYFIELNRKIIQNQLDFSKTKKYLKDWQTKRVIPITYQVTDVAITSVHANEIYAGRQNEVRGIIGNFFTSEYQRRTGHVMYPPLLTESYARDIGDNLRALTWHSPSDTIEVTFSTPTHKIQLDFSGVASQEFVGEKESSVRKDIIYKIWLNGSLDGKSPIKLDEYTTKNFPVEGTDVFFDIPETDTYIELLTSLPKTLAQKIAKEK